MSYLEEFQLQVDNRDFQRLLQLWQEYCANDEVDVGELLKILAVVKKSDLAASFGRYVEDIIPLCATIANKDDIYNILKLVLDIQTTNHQQLADLALQVLKDRYGNQPYFNEKIRLVGFRNKGSFQGAISRYELLSHIDKGKFVYHTAGWGTGEIIDYSLVREEVIVEFENIAGKKDLSFEKAFNTLIPLEDAHFLAKRFSNPDAFEKEAKADPIGVIHLLLKDLGPKTAAEIKDELCELVIPEKEWAKWWQGVRSKLRKDTMTESPASPKEPFRLRESVVSHEEQLKKLIQEQSSSPEILKTAYQFARDLPDTLKNHEIKKSLIDNLLKLAADSSVSASYKLAIDLLLDHYLEYAPAKKEIEKTIAVTEDWQSTLQAIEIVALKKRALVALQQHRADWVECFLKLFFSPQPNPIREYLLKELNQRQYQNKLKQKIEHLLLNPLEGPELFIWYFQKAVSQDPIPFADSAGLCRLFETFLILFDQIEDLPEFKELAKKMYNLLSGHRYQIVRQIIQASSIAFAREFLLLVSKIHSLTDHDLKILQSLAEVVHPQLKGERSRKSFDEGEEEEILWTTEKGYLRIQERIKEIGTVEIVDNAREIEVARSHGDLRENSEYKFALERRSRLQGELKMLSDQFNKARILTADDIQKGIVGVGCVVELTNGKQEKVCYTILGPWDADPENHILSSQSRLAQAMSGLKEKDTFSFRDEEFSIDRISSYFAS